MPIILGLTIHAELSVVIREQVSLRAKVKLTKDLSHPLVILPHQVLTAHLIGLREMVQFLVLCRLFQMIRLCLTGPHDVPLRRVGPNDSEASCLQSIDHRVVDVCCFGDFEAQDHVVLGEVLLSRHLNLLELLEQRLCRPVACLQKASALS